MDMFNSSAMDDLMDQLRETSENMAATQQRMASLTGVAWSTDQKVKVEVGPRGQLIDIEIDPTVFRKPDSHALKESIIEANTAAVKEVAQQVQDIMDEIIPPEVAELREQLHPGEADPNFDVMRTDAEIVAEQRMIS